METRSITAEVPVVPRTAEDPAELVPEPAEVPAALFGVTGKTGRCRAPGSVWSGCAPA